MYNSSERWKKLLADSKKEEEELRNLLEITVYGSFKPDSEKQRLIKLVKAIRSEGFPSCDIVGGKLRPLTNGINNSCMFYLKTSDVNLLVFTQRGKKLGVTDELAYVLYSLEMHQRRHHCAVFDQTSRSEYSALTLKQVEQLKELSMLHVEFKNKRDLHKNAIGTVHNLFKERRLELQMRLRAIQGI